MKEPTKEMREFIRNLFIEQFEENIDDTIKEVIKELKSDVKDIVLHGLSSKLYCEGRSYIEKYAKLQVEDKMDKMRSKLEPMINRKVEKLINVQVNAKLSILEDYWTGEIEAIVQDAIIKAQKG